MQPHIQVVSPVNSRDMADVDTILDRAISAGDPLIATDYGNQLSNTIRLKGVALAKLFFGLKSNWSLFQAAGIQEDFPTFVEANMTVRGRTADKYADMYEEVLANDAIPAAIRDQLKLKPIQTLLLLTAAVREGSLDTEALEDVVVLDHSGVHELVRKARGEATNSSTAVYARLIPQQGLSYPAGTIVVYSADGTQIEPLGTVNLTPRTEAGRKYLERMKNKLGLEPISTEDRHAD
jgi:hypothetical protein